MLLGNCPLKLSVFDFGKTMETHANSGLSAGLIMVEEHHQVRPTLSGRNKGPAKWLEDKTTNNNSRGLRGYPESRQKDLSLLVYWVVLKRNLGYFPCFIKQGLVSRDLPGAQIYLLS